MQRVNEVLDKSGLGSLEIVPTIAKDRADYIYELLRVADRVPELEIIKEKILLLK